MFVVLCRDIEAYYHCKKIYVCRGYFSNFYPFVTLVHTLYIIKLQNVKMNSVDQYFNGNNSTTQTIYMSLYTLFFIFLFYFSFSTIR